ncbi:hypothetical protein NHX12_001545 [Muraenolepis orangiensis]|uniref:Uncharacterized protein n=1 Tax=Muraenolepis orangiensis TaxID=630683 RepID=A0A9Q0II92_9TELE|nr:hypothetical protein NHX12_001545 [Muraenolepis orangiensis]
MLLVAPGVLCKQTCRPAGSSLQPPREPVSSGPDPAAPRDPELTGSAMSSAVQDCTGTCHVGRRWFDRLSVQSASWFGNMAPKQLYSAQEGVC